MTRKIIIGITGASGVIYGIETLRILKDLGFETHLVLTKAAKINISIETDYTAEKVEALAARTYRHDNLAAPLASGSFLSEGMVVIPCTIKTLSGIANSYGNNLLVRSADVTLKEKRKLVLVVRETPLHIGHLKLMIRAAEIGAHILPPVPSFYHKPKTIDDIINQTIGKIFDYLNIQHTLYQRWEGV